MRRAALLVLLAACSGDPIGMAPTTTTLPPIATTTTTTPPGQCAQWYHAAMAVGWPASEWPTIDRVMWAESRCVPNAYNPIGSSVYGHARGLMQIMDELWPEECGITADQLYDPHLNLACALHVWNLQGWEAWSTY